MLADIPTSQHGRLETALSGVTVTGSRLWVFFKTTQESDACPIPDASTSQLPRRMEVQKSQVHLPNYAPELNCRFSQPGGRYFDWSH